MREVRLGKPSIGQHEIDNVFDVLESGHLVQGKWVERFEDAVAEFVGVRHAVAANSCTSALHLSLAVLGVGPGDEVIVPDFTFPATGNVVMLLGATPVLVDIDLDTFCMDYQSFLSCVTKRTKAVVPVHLFGMPCDQRIVDAAKVAGLKVVEDAACAMGAWYGFPWRKAGAQGDAGCFSFHPRKIVTSCEGGMVTTDNDALADRIRSLRNHGKAGPIFAEAGWNYRMSDVHAAVGVAQMGRVEELLDSNWLRAQEYLMLLKGDGRLTPPTDCPGRVWQAFVVLLDEEFDRDAIIIKLKGKGVEATIGTYSLSLQPGFADAKTVGDLRNSQFAYKHGLALPLHSGMNEFDVAYVAGCLKEILDERGVR